MHNKRIAETPIRPPLPSRRLAASFSGAVLAQDKPLKIGVTAGPHAQIFEQVKKVAERDGLKIQVVEFSDYIQPNAALAAGDLDANSYQHKPFLDQQVKDRGYKIVSAATPSTSRSASTRRRSRA
jgi:D-methionine transport system substrate-binding protein